MCVSRPATCACRSRDGNAAARLSHVGNIAKKNIDYQIPMLKRAICINQGQSKILHRKQKSWNNLTFRKQPFFLKFLKPGKETGMSDLE